MPAIDRVGVDRFRNSGTHGNSHGADGGGGRRTRRGTRGTDPAGTRGATARRSAVAQNKVTKMDSEILAGHVDYVERMAAELNKTDDHPAPAILQISALVADPGGRYGVADFEFLVSEHPLLMNALRRAIAEHLESRHQQLAEMIGARAWRH